MSKFFLVLLIGVYITITSYGVICVLKMWGAPVSRLLTLMLMAGWASCCMLSVLFRPGIVRASLQVRKLVIQEEQILEPHFREVLQRAKTERKFTLLIEEELFCNAFASGHSTIVLSRGLLQEIGPEQLKGVLAHELGHLLSGESLALSVLATAESPFKAINAVLYKVWNALVLRLFSYALRCSLLGKTTIAAFSAGLIFWMNAKHLLSTVLATALFLWALPWIDRLVNYFFSMISRFIEYKQDRYAFSLGYGTGLRYFLNSIALDNPQSVSALDIMMGGTHPVIHNRIRRLERLEGLRLKRSRRL
jgi:Zn-dependent protease with chaperone function